MSVLFSNIIRQALITFDQQNISAFKNNFNLLKQLTNQLTINDINLNEELLSIDDFNRPEKAPCTYVHVLQTNNVSMSVFILRNDYTMPLHDHPMMYGILKVLSGKLWIRSYTKKLQTSSDETSPSSSASYIRGAKEINVICEEPCLVTNLSECAILTPTERNYHEITSINCISAFFDILSPPYDSDIPIYGKRKCNFYTKKFDKNIEGETKNLIECKLIKIPSPLTYYCDTREYNPPDFLYEIIKNYNQENHEKNCSSSNSSSSTGNLNT